MRKIITFSIALLALTTFANGRNDKDVVLHHSGCGNGHELVNLEPPQVTYDEELNELYVYFGSSGTIDLENYTSLSDLPSDASIGAIAVVNDLYPVVKTSQGWMIQNLSGTSSSLNMLSTNMALTVGQMAVATDLNKIVFWDGSSHWRDAMGNQV